MSDSSCLKPCLIIAGPTASGKSWLAEELIRPLNGAIINGDSMQVYKGLEVITAQPLHGVHYRLYGVLSPYKQCSVAWWREQAMKEMESAHSKEKLPIIVGGSGLYIKALTEGLSKIPEIPVETRQQVRQSCEEHGVEAIYAKLKDVDPVVAAKLKPQDKQRILRAYEVILATGRSLLEWQEESIGPAPYQFLTVLVLPPKSELDQRIAERFSHMVANGAIEEVRKLEGNPHKAIGVPEIQKYLSGEYTLEQAIEKSVIASRQLAKRQGTWFRNQMKADLLIDHIPTKDDVKEVLSRYSV